jgi:hypothetical protein
VILKESLFALVLFVVGMHHVANDRWFIAVLFFIPALFFFIDVMRKLSACKHVYTNRLTVSGHGLTEYQVWFCEKCPKVFGKQTKNFN